MNLLGSFTQATVTRAALPWLILACVLALSATGASGLYFGSMIERGRHAGEVANLKDAQIEALRTRGEQLVEAQRISNQVSQDFYTALKNIRVVNNTITQEVRREVEKVVYTDCKLPDSGADLLKKKVDSVNLQLLSHTKGDAPKAKK